MLHSCSVDYCAQIEIMGGFYPPVLRELVCEIAEMIGKFFNKSYEAVYSVIWQGLSRGSSYIYRRAKSAILTIVDQLVCIVRLQSKFGGKMFLEHGSINSGLKDNFHPSKIMQEFFFIMITDYLDKETC